MAMCNADHKFTWVDISQFGNILFKIYISHLL